MLNIDHSALCFIIDKARQFHAKEAVVFPEDPGNPSGDWAQQILADHQDDPAYQEAVDRITELPLDEQLELVALMWTGRGDFDIDDWELALEEAEQAPDDIANYLLAHPMLSDYLAEGMAQHDLSCEE